MQIKPKIYCAGPLFNEKEKEEMAEIASSLESCGFDVFLPHRDGLEYAGLFPMLINKGIDDAAANRILNSAIFHLDSYMVLSCDGLILNLNGRVPDEGAMVEAGMAWASGKKVVIYKADSRSLINGSDNPLVLGLSAWGLAVNISDIPAKFSDMNIDGGNSKCCLPNSVVKNISIGRSIFEAKTTTKSLEQLCDELTAILSPLQNTFTQNCAAI